jgi:enamine deaminase RidA (YjgF/YER057c/UK114 family)
MAVSVEARLQQLGLVLPPPPQPVALYVPAVQTGRLLYTSGAGPFAEGRPAVVGRVGENLTLEEGQRAARLVMLNLLSVVREHLGSLDRVDRIVKVLGFVSSAPDFTQQPAVINGASELLVEVFGERGQHARSAIGTSVLPFGIPVEIEMIVQVGPGPTARRGRRR